MPWTSALGFGFSDSTDIRYLAVAIAELRDLKIQPLERGRCGIATC